MAVNLGSINKELKIVKNYLSVWAHEKGFFAIVKCENCKNEFEVLPSESKTKCPKCYNTIKLV